MTISSAGKILHSKARVRTGGPLAKQMGFVAALPSLGKTGDRLSERLVWILVLHIFLEGALRKWGPGNVDSAIYLSRDLLALALYLRVANRLRTTMKAYQLYALAMAIFIGVQQIVHGSPLLLTVTGLRAYLLLPLLILVIGNSLLSQRALRNIQVTAACLAACQLPIVLLQLASPRTAYINRILAEDGRDNIGLAGGMVRPTGTFTSSAGMCSALSLVFALVLADFLARRTFSQSRLPTILFPAVALCLVFSGSRGAVTLALVVCFGALAAAVLSGSPRALFAVVASLATGAIMIWVALSHNSGYVLAFSARIQDAGRSESSVGRVLGDFIGWIHALPHATVLGAGAGSSGNIAIAVGNVEREMWIESDLSRLIYEMGFLVGLLLVAARFVGATVLLRQCVQQSRQSPGLLVLGVGLVWMLTTGAIFGQGTVMTVCGFGVGLFLQLSRIVRTSVGPR